MKKIICIILCLVITMAVGFTASAEEEIETFYTNRFGDIDCDSKITASDARLCLRASADLEVLTDIQYNASDVNSDGVVNSTDARLILRASAKVDVLNPSVGFINKINSKVVIGPLNTAGSGAYVWYCTVEDENTVIVEESILLIPEEEYDGVPVQQFFDVTIAKNGSYDVKFELKNSNNEVIDEFTFEIYCYYTGLIVDEGTTVIVETSL